MNKENGMLDPENKYSGYNGEKDYYLWYHNGILCEMSRQPWGSWCGYCHVPEKLSKPNPEMFLGYIVHGCITYNGLFGGGYPVIGFDLAHFGDLVPRDIHERGEAYFGREYRDETYVREQVESLADQMIERMKEEKYGK